MEAQRRSKLLFYRNVFAENGARFSARRAGTAGRNVPGRRARHGGMVK
jgi:hypothetical protein